MSSSSSPNPSSQYPTSGNSATDRIRQVIQPDQRSVPVPPQPIRRSGSR